MTGHFTRYFKNGLGSLLGLGALMAVMTATKGAGAEEECGEIECLKGQFCQSVELAPDDVRSYCAPDTCDSDADCADYLFCYEQVHYQCPEDLDTGCEDGESDSECAARAQRMMEEQCEATPENTCRPRWQRECEGDSDCGGTGFVCMNNACHPENEDCETDEDCPERWQCMTLQTSNSEVQRCDPINKTIGVGETTTNASGDNESDSVEGTRETDAEPVSEGTGGGCTVRRMPSGGRQSLSLLMAVAFGALSLSRALKRRS